MFPRFHPIAPVSNSGWWFPRARVSLRCFVSFSFFCFCLGFQTGSNARTQHKYHRPIPISDICHQLDQLSIETDTGYSFTTDSIKRGSSHPIQAHFDPISIPFRSHFDPISIPFRSHLMDSILPFPCLWSLWWVRWTGGCPTSRWAPSRCSQS